MTDWCPENDGAYRAELAAYHRSVVDNSAKAPRWDVENDRLIEAQAAQIAELRAGLELISDIEPDTDNMGRFHDIANSALAKRGDRP